LYVVTIPKGGRLKIRDLSFLENWHYEEAHFAGGHLIPTVTYPPGNLALTNIIALRSGSAVREGDSIYHTYFIGTEPDYDNTSNWTNPPTP
jgi:hypothetical protein